MRRLIVVIGLATLVILLAKVVGLALSDMDQELHARSISLGFVLGMMCGAILGEFVAKRNSKGAKP